MAGFKKNNPGCKCCSGGTTFSLPGCACTVVPTPLYMHVPILVSNPLLLSAFPATFVRSAKPADLAGYNADAVGWYSTDTFWSNDGAYHFRYWFGCSQGLYFVHMLPTVDSPVGYGQKILVMTWLVGLSGNTCTPFLLSNGAPQGSTFWQQHISLDANGPA